MDEIVVRESWRDRVAALGTSPRQTKAIVIAVVALVVLSSLVIGRGAPARVAPPAMAIGSPAHPTATTSILFVHVAGEVRAPGLYELHQGARIADAIAAAGGPTRKADVDAVNLADVVADAMKVEVPARGEAVTPTSSMSASPLIDLNSADVMTLEQIPGIGPVRAAAIVQHRDERGPFTSIDQLLEVSGIGPATLESIRSYVTT